AAPYLAVPRAERALLVGRVVIGRLCLELRGARVDGPEDRPDLRRKPLLARDPCLVVGEPEVLEAGERSGRSGGGDPRGRDLGELLEKPGMDHRARVQRGGLDT